MKSALVTVLAVLSLAAPAFARDGAHASCSGFMLGSQPSPDNYGIVVDFAEGRAPGGDAREETISMIWAADLYQGVHINKSDTIGAAKKITLTSKDKKKTQFFKGTYKFVPAPSSKDDLNMVLEGTLNESPYSAKASNEKVSTTLTCVDLSN